MKIEVINNETVVRFPQSLNVSYVQQFIDYITVKSILSKSKATEIEIETLAEEAQEKWWAEDKSKFIK